MCLCLCVLPELQFPLSRPYVIVSDAIDATKMIKLRVKYSLSRWKESEAIFQHARDDAESVDKKRL